jgi:hypothetical protein
MHHVLKEPGLETLGNCDPACLLAGLTPGFLSICLQSPMFSNPCDPDSCQFSPGFLSICLQSPMFSDPCDPDSCQFSPGFLSICLQSPMFSDPCDPGRDSCQFSPYNDPFKPNVPEPGLDPVHNFMVSRLSVCLPVCLSVCLISLRMPGGLSGFRRVYLGPGGICFDASISFPGRAGLLAGSLHVRVHRRAGDCIARFVQLLCELLPWRCPHFCQPRRPRFHRGV